MRALTGKGAVRVAREAPGMLWRRLVRSPRLRVLRLLWETSPRLLVMLALFIVADGFLPILSLVALGRAVGKIPAAVTHGLGSAAGHSLLMGSRSARPPTPCRCCAARPRTCSRRTPRR